MRYIPGRLCGAKKKPQSNSTNWQFSATYACKTTAEKLPAKVNLKRKFGPVYSQTCGNCTSNAVLAIDAYYHHDPKGGWVPSTTFCYWNQRKLDGDGFKEDDGSYIESALEVTRKKGVCNSKVWENDCSWKAKPSEEAYIDGLKGKEITKYYQLKTLLQLKKALYHGYPVAANVDWMSKWFNDFQKDNTLEHVRKKDIEKECVGGHAIVIVGYDDKNELLELRNSWGESWCNKGYAFMAYKTFNNVVTWEDTYAVKG